MEQLFYEIGQNFYFKTDSELYRDVYRAELVAVYPDHLDFRLSLHNGYLLLLPVGTAVHWILNGSPGRVLSSRVLSRNIGSQIWSVTIPATTHPQARKTRVIAVGSGKGGVGKTTFSINLGLALSQCRQRTVLMDADIGMANVEVLLGMRSSLNLEHVINGTCTLAETIVEGPQGLRILPGSSGSASLTHLSPTEFNRIISGFQDLESSCDILILDTGAGLSELVLKFLEAADDFLLVSTPEPHALLDAYSLIKVLSQRNPALVPRLIMNRCTSEQEATQSSQSFIHSANRFLGINPVLLGWLPDERLISRSLKEQTPLFLSHPQTDFSKRIATMARRLAGLNTTIDQPGGLQAFWSRFKRNLS